MLLKILSQEAEGVRFKIVLTAGLSAVANAGILAIVNSGASKADQPSGNLFFLFLLACVVYAVCMRISTGLVSELFETVLLRFRVRIADKIRNAELQGVERIGVNEIYDRLTQETAVISQAAGPIAASLQCVVMLSCVSFYIFSLSRAAFFMAVVVLGAGSLYQQARTRQAAAHMKRNSQMHLTLLDRLNDLLRGFKELRLRSSRSDQLFKEYHQLAENVRTGTIQVNVINESNFIIVNLNFFALLATLVFILPQFIKEYPQVLSNLTSATLFMFGSMMGLLWALPQYGRANMAAENIYRLEQKLESASSSGPEVVKRVDPWKESWHGEFKELRADDIQYRYISEGTQEPFSIGPLSLTITAGEIVFIVGGNGSGKSTLVKVLTGLYPPTAGEVLVNGVPLAPENVQAYREKLAAIFGDFHLFKKLYGLPEHSDEEVARLLEKMEIANKTTLSEGVFSTLELSTGQRKRLAMVVALLEDRPIYVLDEWAADQDPEFRRYFYEDMLQELKRRGKTVIAISHDDRYFHCADRVLTMEYGQLRSIESHAAKPATQPALS